MGHQIGGDELESLTPLLVLEVFLSLCSMLVSCPVSDFSAGVAGVPGFVVQVVPDQWVLESSGLW